MRILRILLPIMILVTVAMSCDYDANSPIGPPTLDSLWPDTDGTLWSYQWLRNTIDSDPPQSYGGAEEVPPAPGFVEANDILMGGAGLSEPTNRQYLELLFDGSGTTLSGVEGKNLREILYVNEAILRVLEVDGETTLLSKLATFRPDLRDQLEPLLPSKADIFDRIASSPTFLRGGIFEKTEQHIGTYADLDQDLAWLFLNANTRVGNQFSLQLTPSLADDVWLHGFVLAQRSFSTGGRTFHGCLEMLYVLDWGVADRGGDEFTRQFSVGTVIYAPGMGPIYSNERSGVDATPGNDEGWAYAEVMLLPSDLPVPDAEEPSPTLENIWPNADGNSWYYSSQANLGNTTRTLAPEAPLPSMEELYDWVHGPSDVDSSWGLPRGFMNLQFHGMRTTESGATGQDLRESMYFPLDSGMDRVEVDRTGSLLRHVLRARPELREKALRLYPKLGLREEVSKQQYYRDAEPFFLFGYVWEKTGEHIGTYGDIDRLLAWKFLEANLSTGHEFSHQLVPGLADDVWLYARVWRELDFSVGERTYANCIEVLYAIDFGEQVQTDEGGNVINTWRSYGAGTLVYAPKVGPIHLRERTLLAPDTVTISLPLAIERVVELIEAHVVEGVPDFIGASERGHSAWR